MMYYLIRFWKSLFVLGAILFLSFIKPASLPRLPEVSSGDKVAHVLMYLVFTFVLFNDYYSLNKIPSKKWRFIIVCLLFPFLLGGITELFQTIFFFPRQGDLLDWLSNTLGVLLGWGAYHVLKRKK